MTGKDPDPEALTTDPPILPSSQKGLERSQFSDWGGPSLPGSSSGRTGRSLRFPGGRGLCGKRWSLTVSEPQAVLLQKSRIIIAPTEQMDFRSKYGLACHCAWHHVAAQ